MPRSNEYGPTVLERVVAGICYLTMGLAGLLFIIISGQRVQSDFFRFHFMQSIIIGIIGLILSWCSGILYQILGGLLGMLAPALGGAAPQVSYWLGQSITIILNAFYLLLVYGMVWAFLGKFAEVPFISDVVRRQMR